MSADEDFSSLPLLERWQHSKWNVRQDAYKEAAASFARAEAAEDECFAAFTAQPALLRGAATDANVAALDAGIAALIAYASNVDARAAGAARTVALRPMLDKGLAAAKPTVKAAAAAAALTFIELAADPAADVLAVVEELVALLGSKLPKVVAAAAGTLADAYTQFGAKTVPPQPALRALPKLFAHADRTVRAEAVRLSVALVRWLGAPVLLAALDGIKPVQLKELEEQFASAAKEGPPTQDRLLRVQVEAAAAREAAAAESGGAPEGTAAADMSIDGPAGIDPFDLLDPVAVLAKIPANVEADLASAKWKERKEALDTLVAVLNAPRLAPEDFGPLVSQLQRVIARDANIMCATQAVVCVRELATGLRTAFARYAPTVLQVTIERYREKKPTVVEAVNQALDAILAATSLGEVLPALLAALTHKVPAVKIESLKFLTHALAEAPQAPPAAEIKNIAAPAVKLMTDTQEPVRAAAAGLLGVLAKIVGDKAFAPVIDGLDDLRKGKVREAAEAATVKARLSPAGRAPAAAAAPAPISAASTAPAAARAAPSAGVSARTASAAGAASTARSLSARPAATSTPARPAAGSALKRTVPPSAGTGATSAAPVRVAASPRSSRAQMAAGTPAKKPGARGVHTAEFTPARQPVAARRRLVSPLREGPATSSIGAGVGISARPLARPAVPTATPFPVSTAEVEMLRREKLVLAQEKDLLARELSQERAWRENAEHTARQLELQLETLQSEMHQMRLQLQSRSRESANSGLGVSGAGVGPSRAGAGAEHGLESVSLGMTRMSLGGRGPPSGAPPAEPRSVQRSSQLFTLGTPRSPLTGFDGSPKRDLAGPGNKENYQRATAVAASLRTRLDAMKKERAAAAAAAAAAKERV